MAFSTVGTSDGASSLTLLLAASLKRALTVRLATSTRVTAPHTALLSVRMAFPVAASLLRPPGRMMTKVILSTDSCKQRTSRPGQERSSCSRRHPGISQPSHPAMIGMSALRRYLELGLGLLLLKEDGLQHIIHLKRKRNVT